MRNKGFDYFQHFVDCSQLALEAARYLQTILTEFDPSMVRKNMEDMHRIENDADMKKHEMLKKLAHEFMTPIEREDIVELAQQMDNVVDAIEDVALHLYMFDVHSIREDTAPIAALIVKCCEALVEMMREFHNFRKSRTIKDRIIEINTIESDGDRMHAANMRALFTDGADMREVTTWMVMYERLEDCLDACEDAADIIEGVIMKNT